MKLRLSHCGKLYNPCKTVKTIYFRLVQVHANTTQALTLTYYRLREVVVIRLHIGYLFNLLSLQRVRSRAPKKGDTCKSLATERIKASQPLTTIITQ